MHPRLRRHVGDATGGEQREHEVREHVDAHQRDDAGGDLVEQPRARLARILVLAREIAARIAELAVTAVHVDREQRPAGEDAVDAARAQARARRIALVFRCKVREWVGLHGAVMASAA
jgi:hypothetical protein